jgi:uncharacterized protein with GYD domain
MPKFVTLFSLTSDSLARLIEHPNDRRGPVGRLAEAAGGRLEAYYWMFGQYDGMAIFDMPDSTTQAALVLAVSSSGVFRQAETHELIEADALVAILQKAQTLRPNYQPPGQTSG